MSETAKRALVVVAHGSRRGASNDEIRELAQRLGADDKNDFDMVVAAYLELAEPSIPDGIEACIQQGARQVIVFPYFLSKGRHVVEDIPAEVRIKQDEHPTVEIILADYLGVAEGMPRMIFDHLQSERVSVDK